MRTAGARRRPLAALGRIATAAVAVALVVTPAPAQEVGARDRAPVDEKTARRVLEEAQKRQVEFEQYREDHTPIARNVSSGGSCDEQIGRICIWFGGADEDQFPGELREVGQARVELIRSLRDALEVAPHRWILGQLVHYLVENGNVDEAERVASECGIEEDWWCMALLGYALHKKTEYIEAEAFFRDALRAMPEDERAEWSSMRYVLTDDARDQLDDLPPSEREAAWELYWRLSDPLFLFEGNDRFTDHFSRWVLAKNQRRAAQPLGLKMLAKDQVHRPGTEWDEDLEETLIRYGMNIGYSRTHQPAAAMGLSGGFGRRRGGFGGGEMQDTRRMIGHHHPKSRGYLFPEQFLESPADVPPESWITAPREARTWHAPLYAPEINGLETQVGRFRRDDAMLVVGAYRPTERIGDGSGRVESVWASEADVSEPPYSSLFLLPEGGGPMINVRERDSEGVLTIEARPGRYVSSLEVVDLPNRRAWRARQGIVQEPLTPGLVAVSDLMILKEGTPLPDSFEEALPNVRPGVRLRTGERFPVFWEVYGLRLREPVRVTVGFSEGRPGFLERVGDFLGVIEPEQPVEITFDDVGPDEVQAVFRSVELELPDLEPGDYTLHLRLELPGRTPVLASRPIIVER